MGRKTSTFKGTAEGHGSVGHATHGRRFPLRTSVGPTPVTVRRVSAGELRELKRITKPAVTSPFGEDEDTRRRRNLFTR